MPRVLTAIMFFPRGGSAHTARGLALGLSRLRWSIRLVAGSRSDLGPDADARPFYCGLDLQTVDFTPSLREEEPLHFSGTGATAPMHPSYEDREDAPDRVFASLDDLEFERQVRAWSAALERAGAQRADLLHLHHLTPIHEAAARVAPDVPVIGQLHGTELLMLEQIEAGPPRGWGHAAKWAERMRGWAASCRRLLVAPGAIDRARDLLGLDRDRIVPVANGFDSNAFHPRDLDRFEHWRRCLVERPRGWLPGGEPGSARYREDELASFQEGVVLVYVGRYTEVKRIPLLIRAHARARDGFECPAPLVLVGGHPGEWEGDHPAEVIAQAGARDVFLAGWHDHDELPWVLAASDLLVFPSVREQFGQALIEAMACGLPVVAAASSGARQIVEPGDTGWLVPPDDETTLAEALVEAVNDGSERRRRGSRARESVTATYSWERIAEEVAGVFAAEVGEREGPGTAAQGPAEDRPLHGSPQGA